MHIILCGVNSFLSVKYFEATRALTSQNLIEKQLAVVLGQLLRTRNDLVQVGLHEFGENVNFVK